MKATFYLPPSTSRLNAKEVRVTTSEGTLKHWRLPTLEVTPNGLDSILLFYVPDTGEWQVSLKDADGVVQVIRLS